MPQTQADGSNLMFASFGFEIRSPNFKEENADELKFKTPVRQTSTRCRNIFPKNLFLMKKEFELDIFAICTLALEHIVQVRPFAEGCLTAN